MKKLPFIHFLLEVLKASAKKHGLSKPLTLGHLLGIVVLANKLNKKHNGKVNRYEAELHRTLLEQSRTQ